MRFSELCDGILTPGKAGFDPAVTRIAADSRQVVPGTVFVAVRGSRSDGRSFLGQAWRNGAVAAVTETPDPQVPIPQFSTENARETYALLCSRFWGDPAGALKITGITGTNGKTTTAYLLRHMLRSCGIPCGMIGTVETDTGATCRPSHATTPDPWELHRDLAETVRNRCTHAVAEVSSQALDQSRVAGMTFAVGILTNLSSDHLDYHRTFDAYREAKRKLFDQSRIRIVNADSDYAAPFLKYPGVLRFSLSEETDFFARNVRTENRGISYEVCSPSGCREVFLPALGRVNAYNSLAAFACAEMLGADPDRCAASLASFPGVPGRLERLEPSLPFILIRDFAHTPDGLENALRSVRLLTRGRVIAVFGCGGDRDRGKRAEMGRIASRLADLCIITSDNPRSEDPEAILSQILSGAEPEKCLRICDRTDAIRAAVRAARPGDCVLLAGKGHETSQIFSDHVVPYDEREIARDILKEEGFLK